MPYFSLSPRPALSPTLSFSVYCYIQTLSLSVSLEMCNLVIRRDRSQETRLKMKTGAKQDVV